MNRSAGKEVSLVLPCLNEEAAVGQCVEHALSVMREAGLDGCVIVVDNGSTDRSVEVARNAGAIVIYQSQPGYGAALRSGFEYSQATYCVMADADGTYEFEALARVLHPVMNDDADLVLGSRLGDATTESMPFLHRFLGTPAISYLVNRATKGKVTVRDSQSGYRAFRRERMMSLPLSSTGMEFASEMIIRSAWAGFRIHEVETKYAERIGDSKLDTWSDGMRHLRKIIQLDPEGACTLPAMVSLWGAVATWLSLATVPGLRDASTAVTTVLDVIAFLFTLIAVSGFSLGRFMRFRAQQEGHFGHGVGATLKGTAKKLMTSAVATVGAGVASLVALVANSLSAQLRLSHPVANIWTLATVSTLAAGLGMFAISLLGPLVGEVNLRVLPDAMPAYDFDRDYHLAAASGF